LSATPPPARRAYASVAVVPGEAGLTVCLDGKPLRSPAGTVLAAPNAGLAEAIAEEWRAQPPKLDIGRAPLTRLLGTALDRIPRNRSAIEAELCGYAETELVCHWAERPAELVLRQQAMWQPLLDWFAHRYDAPLVVTSAVIAVAQPDASLAAIRRSLAGVDDLRMTGLSLAVGTAGSLVIGCALAQGHLDSEAAFQASELEQSFQIEQWGEDPEATRRRAQLRVDLDLVVRWLALSAT